MKRTIIAALVGLTLNAFAGNPFTSERYEEAFKLEAKRMVEKDPYANAVHIKENEGVITNITILSRKAVDADILKTTAERGEPYTIEMFQQWMANPQAAAHFIKFTMCYTGHVKGHDLDWKPAFPGDIMGLGQYWTEPSENHFTVLLIFDDGTPFVQFDKSRTGGPIKITRHSIK